MSECKFECQYHKGHTCGNTALCKNRCNALRDRVKCMFAGQCGVCKNEACAERKGLISVTVRNRQAQIIAKELKEKEHYKDDPREISAEAYVDGSFNPETNTYGYGGFIRWNKNELPFKGSGQNKDIVGMRNVAGEILGAMVATVYAKKIGASKLTIYYDYEGTEHWVSGYWNANKTGTQAYRDYMRTCGLKLKFVKVKGHSGNEGNEKADRLAKQAVGVA